ncbi:MAG: HYR domain-containing protein, partial [Chitinophagales bacterium]
VDFADGTTVSNGSANPLEEIYEYEEIGFNIDMFTQPGNANNFFELVQNFGEYDAVLDAATDGSGVAITYGPNGTDEFDLIAINVDNPGMQIAGYQGATLVASVTITTTGVYTFGSDFQDLTGIVWTNTDPRSVIEEFIFRDNARVLDPGFYEITYTVGEEPCVESTTHTIEVYPTRSTDIETVTVCQSPSGTVNLSAMYTDETTLGGEFTVVGTNLSIMPTIDNDVLNYELDFIDIPPYFIDVQYALDTLVNTFNPGDCNPEPTVARIWITDITETGYDLPDTWCVEDGAIDLTTYTIAGGGTYSLASSPEVPLTGDVYIPQNGDGLVEILYTPVSDGCGTPSTEVIEIIDEVEITLTPAGPFCPNGAIENLEVTVTVSTPYPQGTIITYPAGHTTTIPAGTSVTYESPTGFVSVTANGMTLNVPSGSTLDYQVETTVTFDDGAIATFETVTVTELDPVECGYWYGDGISDAENGTFNPSVVGVGTYAVTFIVKKGDCIVEATMDIIVEDVDAPVIDMCPADVEVNTTSCSGFVTVENPQASDNCGVESISFVATHTEGTTPGGVPPGLGTVINAGVVGSNFAASGVYPVGTTTIVWTVTDVGGNTETCETVIMVIDNQLPGIFCPSSVITNAEDGTCEASVNVVTPFTSDNCGVASVTFEATHVSNTGGEAVGMVIGTGSNNASGVYPGGITEIVWTVTDVSGNTNTCMMTVTVIDNQIPEFVACPSDIVVNTIAPNFTNPQNPVYYCDGVAMWTPPTAIDNCSEGVDQTIIDTYLTAQDDLAAAQAALLLASADLAAAQNAYNAAETALSFFPTDPDLIDARDDALTMLNAAQLVFNLLEVEEDQAQMDFDAAEAALLAAQAAADLTITSTHNSGDIFPLGTTTVTYTVTDAAGNSNTCSFTVTVIDEELPTFTCPADISYTADFGECQGEVIVDRPTLENDNCGVAAVYNDYNGGIDATDAYPVGTTLVTWYIEDVNGNVNSCSMNVTVVDDQAPIITYCPDSPIEHPLFGDAIVVPTDAGLCAADVTVPMLEATDNCDVATITFEATQTVDTEGMPVNIFVSSGADDASGVYPSGITEIVWTVTDVNGNTAMCTTTVVVIDGESPTLTCPDDITVTTDPIICASSITTAFVTVPQPNVSDNCGVATLINDYNGTDDASDVYPLGDNIVTWSAIDANGNTISCSMTITVLPCCEADAGILSVIPQDCPGTPVVLTVCDPVLFEALEQAENDLLFAQQLVAERGAALLDAAVAAGFGGTDLVDLQAELGNPFNQALIDAVNVEYQEFMLANMALDAAEAAYATALATYEASCTNNTTAEYGQAFIIVDENGIIVAIDDDGIIQTLGTSLPAGTYYAYSYNYLIGDEPDLAPYIGGMMAEIGINDEGCYATSVTPVVFTVATGSPGLSTGPNTFEGDDSVGSPFSYNINLIEIVGGTPPYDYLWDVTGYVRYSIVEIDDTAYIYIVYTDNASWTVTVSDYDDCDVNYAVYTNEPDVPGGAGAILDIYDSAVTPQSDGDNPNGAIDISVEGGTPCAGGGYTYEWYYQDGTYMGDTEDLTDLATGWYTVYVTDCGVGEDQQSSIGWYWVEPARRGRGKTELGEQTLAAYPNPFSETTMIEFSVAETSMTDVSIYSIDGQKVADVFSGLTQGGETQRIDFKAGDLASGMYFVSLTTENGETQRYKLVLTK